MNLRVRDVMHADQILPRPMIVQRKDAAAGAVELTETIRSVGFLYIKYCRYSTPRSFVNHSRYLTIAGMILLTPLRAATGKFSSCGKFPATANPKFVLGDKQ